MEAVVLTDPLSKISLLMAYPEIVLAVGSMILLMAGVYMKGDTERPITIGAIVLLAIAFVIVLLIPDEPVLVFNSLFISDHFGRFMKGLILIGGIGALLMSSDFLRRERIARFEYPVLVVIAVLGMLLMVSAHSLMALYLGLELQSLALYVIAAFNRDSIRSSEAGLKYFVLGALSSGMLLYGMSLIYGFTGSTDFGVIAAHLQGADPSVGFVFGLVFMLAGLAFKISAVPFHMWTPDVYEGAPTPVTAFFAGAPKIAAMALFLRVLFDAFPDATTQWQQVLVFMSILSMIVGAYAAIQQTNIKRLMAYSSIGHMGYALIGLAAGTETGVQGVIIYLGIYLVTNLGVFCCILAMRRENGMVEEIADLAGLSQRQPLLAAALAAFMLSLAGIPPLAGFFAKFYVFLAAIESGLFTLAILGVLASAVAAFYYLRIIKIMYFDAPAEPFEARMALELRVILTVSGLFTVLFFVFPSFLIDGAASAAAALVQ